MYTKFGSPMVTFKPIFFIVKPSERLKVGGVLSGAYSLIVEFENTQKQLHVFIYLVNPYICDKKKFINFDICTHLLGS